MHASSARRPGPGERPRTYSTEAIVLRSVSVREADRLVTVLTPGLGKLPVTVRGARRITSRLGGHLDALNRTRLTLALGHRIDVVTGAESLESFGCVKANLRLLATAIYLTELADALLPEASSHPRTYALLLDALRALDRSADGADLLARYAELRMLEDAGYMPELQQCVVCGEEIAPERHRYAPDIGGVACDGCTIPHGRALPLSVNGLKMLRHFARANLQDGISIRVSDALKGELELLLAASLTHVLEREMRSPAFIGHLRRLREQHIMEPADTTGT